MTVDLVYTKMPLKRNPTWVFLAPHATVDSVVWETLPLVELRLSPWQGDPVVH